MYEASQAKYEPLRRVIEYLLQSGGKRLRPALALLAARFHPAVSRSRQGGTNCSPTEAAVALAAAVEMLHTATLVHDDIIDDSPLRRGNPTLNTFWSSEATILAGDYLFARAASLAAETENVRVMAIFAETLMSICSGQLKEIFEDGWRNPSRQDYYQRIYSKTASLFALSTEAGAVLSGAPEKHICALRAYGENLGLAFQIVDDVLDFTGDESELGKPVGSDLRQRVLTLPTLNFLERYPREETLISIFEGGARNDEQIRRTVKMIKESGAIEAAMLEACQFARRSQEALNSLPDNKYRQALLDLADYVVERQQ